MNKMIDLTNYEEDDKFLEGTGSIVFDYAGFTLAKQFDPRLY